MHEKIVCEGNAVYEVDEECIRKKERRERRQEEHAQPPKQAENHRKMI